MSSEAEVPKQQEQEQQQPQQKLNPNQWTKRGALRTKSKESCMAMTFSSDGSLLASGNFAGDVVIWDTHALSRIHEVNLMPLAKAFKNQTADDADRTRLPITALAFRPMAHGGGGSAAGNLSSLRPVLLITASNGMFVKLDAQTAEVIGQPGREEGNEIFAAAWSPSGALFATAGRDGFVRVYTGGNDAVEPIKKFTISAPGVHNSAPQRVFSLAFANETTVLAAGWSQTVVAFDLNHPGGYIEPHQRNDVFGPFLSGNSLAVVPRRPPHSDADAFLTSTSSGAEMPFDIFAASYRMNERLQLFDGASMMQIGELQWPDVGMQFLPLCAASSPDGSFLAIGGGGGHGFDDGGIVFQCPSAEARQAAAAHAHSIKVAANKDRHEREAAGDTGAGAVVSENSQTEVMERMKAHWVASAKAPPVCEFKQPGRPVMVCAFSISNNVAFGDNEGLIHVFEPSRRRHQ